MAEKEIRRISIEPAENGGHTVEHNYKPQPKKSGRNGITMDYPDSDTHVFGAEEDEKLLSHLAKHLKLKSGKKVVDKDGDGE